MTRPAANAQDALDHVARGGRAYVATQLRITIIDKKVLRRFEKAGAWLFKDDGKGIRMASGRSSVYLLPGQLQLTD